MPASLKTVSYRGGVLVFQIPAAWKEEYGEGAAFYDDVPGSPTLRLNLITAEMPGPPSRERVLELLRSRAAALPQPEILENADTGNLILRYTKEASADTVNFCWEVGGFLPPRHARLALFALEVRDADLATPATKATVELLDSALCAARCADRLGA